MDILLSRFYYFTYCWITHTSLLNPEGCTFTVEETVRVIDNNKSRYLVFTEDEIFENTDTFLSGNLNSSDVHKSLEEGHVYRAKVAGIRAPFLSWYRNIISVSEER